MGHISKKKLLSMFLAAFASAVFWSRAQTCDEFPISLQVGYIGTTELSARLCGNDLLLSLDELFEFLRIKAHYDAQRGIYNGYIWGEKDTYHIDLVKKELVYRNKVYHFSDTDKLHSGDQLFLRDEVIATVFGLRGTFDYRNLSLTLKTDAPLPYVKKLIREEFYSNIGMGETRRVADSVVYPAPSLFRLGVGTWDLFSTQRADGVYYGRLSLGVGGEVLGGELSTTMNLVADRPFDLRDQFYRWRMVRNKSEWMRQLVLGKMRVPSRASIFSPVVGTRITNAPSYREKTFGTHTISGFTKAGWMVELYINDVLVDYTKADANGHYRFELPLAYGSTTMDLRYYGPFGEEEHTTKQLNIPYDLKPRGSFEYDVNLGVVEDSGELFMQSAFDYGLTRHVTLGGGMEFLSSRKDNRLFPFLNANVRMGSNVLVSGEYMHKVGLISNLNYRSPNDLQLDLSYTRYQSGQQTVLYTYREQRSAILTTPLGNGNFKLSSRLALRHTLFANNDFINLDWLLSTQLLGLNANVHTRAFFNRISSPNYLTRLTLSKALPSKLFVSSQIEHSLYRNRITTLRGEVSKMLFKDTYFRASLEQNFRYDQLYLNFGVNIGLGFSRIALSSNLGDGQHAFSQSLVGSVNFDGGDMLFDELATLGLANVKFEPFLDSNGNDKKDPGEILVKGIEVHSINGGKERRLASGGVVFTAMEPYVEHYFTLEPSGLQSIGWLLEDRTIQVWLSPNQIKRVQVPVKVVGEVAGHVKHEGAGVGKLKMHLYRSRGVKIAELISKNDGYFGHYGLSDGSYSIALDTLQLAGMGLGVPKPVSFTVENGRNGAYIDGLTIDLVADTLKVAGMATDFEDNGPSRQSRANGTQEGIGGQSYMIVGKDTINLVDKFSLLLKAIGIPGDEVWVNHLMASYLSDLRFVQMDTHFLKQGLPKSDTYSLDHWSGTGNGLDFGVQLLKTQEPWKGSDNATKGLRGLQEYYDGRSYRYILRRDLNPAQALALRESLVGQGFVRAIPVPTDKFGPISPNQVIGRILFYDAEGSSGLAGATVVVRDSLGNAQGTYMSEADGTFTIRGLPEGKYRAELKTDGLESFRPRKKAFSFNVLGGTLGKVSSQELLLEAVGAKEVQRAELLGQNTDLSFKVQVLASNRLLPKDHALFNGAKDLGYYYHQGMHKYTMGQFSLLTEARALRFELQKNGFRDAFVVCFFKGKRLQMLELTGRVFLSTERDRVGMEGIKMNIYDGKTNELITGMVSEEGGYFNFLGLKPGAYLLELDKSQLEMLGLTTQEYVYHFQVNWTEHRPNARPLLLELLPQH